MHNLSPSDVARLREVLKAGFSEQVRHNMQDRRLPVDVALRDATERMNKFVQTVANGVHDEVMFEVA